jgi:lantibiotic modifying enzyme
VKSAAEHIRKNAVKGDTGVYWETPARLKAGKTPGIDFYSGSSGIILFFLELHAYTGDKSYLVDAVSGAEYILALFEKHHYDYQIKPEFELKPYSKNQWSFYVGGIGGIAFSLIHLYQATGDKRYKDAAFTLTGQIAGAAQKTRGGITWSGYSGINQDGGTILYLLYAANYFEHPEWKDLAKQGALAIAATETDAGGGRSHYAGLANPLQDFSKTSDGKAFFPGFSYGDSGLAYVFAKVYEETGEKKLLEAAEKAADYLIAITDPIGEKGGLIPYWQPENPEGIHYLGFCHGPVGSSRVFVLLHRLTKKEKYRDFYLRLTEGIIESGAPEYHSTGYWDCHCLCCGTAGFVNHFLGIWLETGDSRYFDYALRSARVILGSANYNGKAAVWYQVFMRTWPDIISADIGYYNGSAGIAAMLIRAAAALENRLDVIRLPDDPYPASKKSR